MRVALLSVPYSPRGKVKPTEWEQKKYPGKIFYQASLRAPGVAINFLCPMCA